MGMDGGPGSVEAFDAKALRRAFGCYATGVAVITTCGTNDIPVGMTVNSVSSVSLDPPLLLFCVGHSNIAAEAYTSCENFVVNVLDADQAELSQQFACSMGNKWENVRCQRGTSGALILKDALAYFECARTAAIAAGDHTIVLGEVQSFGHREAGMPLGFFRGRYGTFSVPSNQQTSGEPSC